MKKGRSLYDGKSAAPGGSVHGERANFTRLVLGCIETKFCKKTHVKALAEIYTIHSFAQLSKLNVFVNNLPSMLLFFS